MKGQQKIFEELLVFSLGLGLASMLLMTFGNISKNIENTNVENQLRDVNNLISAMIVNVYESGENTTMVAKIPTLIGDEPYYIEASGDELKTYTKEKEVTNRLYNINVDGKVISSTWYIKLRNDGMVVHIERWGY